MKLNKVISLVLGGVMALSMLAGCSGTTTVSETPIDNATITNTASGVVALVQAGMSRDKVGQQQTEETLAGGEAKALSIFQNWYNQDYDSDVNNYDILKMTDFKDLGDNGDLGAASTEAEWKKYYMYIVPKAGNSDADMVEAILDIMEDRYDGAKTNNINDVPVIDNLTVMDMSNLWDSYYAGYNSGLQAGITGNMTVTVNGTEYNMSDCWVVVFYLGNANSVY